MPSSGEAPGDIDVLIADYVAAKDDQRSMDQSLIGVATIALVVMGAFVKILADACGQQLPKLKCEAELWAPVYAVLPMAPLALLSFVVLQGALTSQRAYYIRTVERRLQEHMVNVTQVGEQVPHPAFEHLAARMRSHHRGHARFRVLVGAIYFSIAVVLVATTVVSVGVAAPGDIRLFAALFYTLCGLVLARTAFDSSMRAARMWQEIVADFDGESARTATLAAGHDPGRRGARRRPGTRSLSGYLLLPRRGDLVKVAFILVTPFIARAVAGQGSWWHVTWQMVVGLVAIDLLAYQGRYILNDLRTAKKDAAQSAFKARERFPLGPDGTLAAGDVRTALVVVLVRFALAFYVAVRLGDDARQPTLVAAIVLVLVIAVVYERLREREDVPDVPFTYGRLNAAVLVVVGFGYALRTYTGWSIGAPGTLTPAATVLLGAALIAFGSMFVAMTFVFQSLHLVRVAADEAAQVADGTAERLTLYVDRVKAAEAPHKVALLGDAVRGGARPKPTPAVAAVGAPAGSLPLIEADIPAPVREVAGLADRRVPLELARTGYTWRVLSGCSSPRAWWNGAFLLSMALAAAFGVVVSADPVNPTYVAVAAVATAALARVLLPWPALAALAVPVAPGIAWYADAPVRGVVAAGVLGLVVAATYSVFSGFTLGDLEADVFTQLGVALARLPRRVGTRALAMFVGDGVAKLTVDGESAAAKK